MNRLSSARRAPSSVPTGLSRLVRRDTIVIGASAGGVRALQLLLGALPADLPASVLVVLHQMPGHSELARLLSAVCALPVERVDTPRPLRSGRVYVASPDRHMVVVNERVQPADGPREKHCRPAINPLYRSAAVSRGARVVAVQLTGMLDDGVAGLDAVARCGGAVLVQDPAEAAHSDMPRNAIERVRVDHVVTLDKIATLLRTLVDELVPPVPVPSDIVFEAGLAEGGPAVNGDPALGLSLLVALQALEERVGALERLATDDGARRPHMVSIYRERANEMQAHAERVRRFLRESGEAEDRQADNETTSGGPLRRVGETALAS